MNREKRIAARRDPEILDIKSDHMNKDRRANSEWKLTAHTFWVTKATGTKAIEQNQIEPKISYTHDGIKNSSSLYREKRG